MAESGADAAAAREVQVERELLQSGGVGGGTAYHGSVPVIDLALPEEVCAAAMWEAATEVGFFTVINHGIPTEAIEAAFGASTAFFGQEQKHKEAQSPFARQLNSGYEYMTQVRPSTGTPDQKESLQITARAGAMDDRWPQTPADFEATARSFSTAAHALGQRILSLLEPQACPHLPVGTLAGAHTLWADDGQCTLRMLHYPPVEPAEVPPNYWRAGPHTDWCCATLLFQLPGNEGLECAANPRAGGGAGWLRVDPVEGGIAINIGDMLSRWSDDRLLSNLHRVRMPTPAEATPPKSRYSIAFFMQADKQVLIESRHGAITAGDYILGRIRSNFAK
jgi:isopenicillin N synthase-like dioxygenase